MFWNFGVGGTFLWQKSHAKWWVEGENNTKYFQLHSKVVRKILKDLRLQNDHRVWLEDRELLQTMAQNFYIQLYTLEPTDACPSIVVVFPQLLCSDTLY